MRCLEETSCKEEEEEISLEHLLAIQEAIGKGLAPCTVADSEGVGDSIEVDPGDCLRILTCNVNGFSEKNKFDGFEDVCETLLAHHVHVAGFTEPNMDFKKDQVRRRIRKTALDITKMEACRSAKVTMASSSLPAEHVYKPGGVMSLAFNQGCARQTHAYADKSGMGRYTVNVITGNGKHNLAIITAYQTCRHHCGPTSAAQQQVSMMAAKGMVHVSPREQLLKDLDEEIVALRAKGNQCILMGDFNTNLGSADGRELVRFLEKHDLVDPMVEKDIDFRDMATHRRGSHRIDFLFVPNAMMPFVHRFGVLPFDRPIVSDHRPTFCDINMKGLFGSPAATIATPSTRGVQSKDSRQALKFVYKLDEMFQARHVYGRSQGMLTLVGLHGPTNRAAKQMRGVDKDLREIMLAAEKRTTRRYNSPWSKELGRCFRTHRFWRLYTRNFHQLDGYMGYLNTLARDIGWTDVPNVSLAEAVKAMRTAGQKLRDARRNAEDLRASMLGKDLKDATSSGDTKKATAVRAIMRCEATKKSFEKLRWARGKIQGDGLRAVQVENPSTKEIETVTDPQVMYPLLVEQGTRHFAQADGTPFASKPLADVQYTATSLQAARLVSGCSEFEKDDRLSKATQDWIRHSTIMGFRKECEDISSHISPEEARMGFMAWRETTSTSPAGDHLGLYRALGRKYNDTEIAEVTKYMRYTPRPIEIIQKEIWFAISAIMNMGASFGLTIPRWESAVCAMIEKAPGNFLLNKLRRIFLLPSDMNLMMGILVGRRLVWSAEEKNQLDQDIWGSRPGRGAPDATLAKELTYGLSRLTLTPLATCDNDAKSCYDRVVLLVAALLARRYGLPAITTEWMFNVHKDMKNFPKTGHGIGPDPFKKKHGLGQGNRGAPAIWLFVSSFLFERMRRLALGIHFTCTKGRHKHNRRQDAYVDDVTQFFNKFNESLSKGTIPLVELTEGMRHDAEAWAEQIHISGGALEPTKSFWYLMYWTVDATNRPVLASKEELEAKGVRLAVRDFENGGTKEIKLVDCTEGHRTLGAFKSPEGNENLLIRKLMDKSTVMGQQIRRTNLTKEEARMAAEAILLPSLSYPLATSHLTEKDAQRIHSNGLNSCIQQAGFAKSTARSIIHGPWELGGASFGSLYASQTWLQLDIIQHHLRQKGNLGDLVRIALDWTQTVAGLCSPILEEVVTDLSYVKHNLFISLREGLRKCKACLRIFDAPKTDLLREGDVCLMEEAHKWKDPKLPFAWMEDINLCRMFLGVATLADCTSPDGIFVDRGVYEGVCDRGSIMKWPAVHAPTEIQWGRWRNFLVDAFVVVTDQDKKGNRRCCTKNRTILRLRTPLRRWIQPPLSRQLFPQLMIEGRIWSRLGTNYVLGSRSTPFEEVPSTAVPWSTLDAGRSKTSGREIKRDLKLSKTQRRHEAWAYEPPQVTQCIPTLVSVRGRMTEDWKISILSAVDVKDDTWSTCCKEKALLFVSDGGAKDMKGSYGCVVASVLGEPLISTRGMVQGADPRSFRAEAWGMLTNLLILDAINTNRETTVKATFYCDNESLVKMMTKAKSSTNPTTKRNCSEYDLISSCIETLWPWKNHIEFRWVRGHQDDKKIVLNIQEQLNVIANDEATVELRNKEQQRSILFPSGATQLDIGGRTITRHGRRAIFDSTHRNDLLQTIKKSHRWTDGEEFLVDWEALGQAMKGYTNGERTSRVKICNLNLPLGERLCKWSTAEDGLCPQCGDAIETQTHMFTCPGATEDRSKERILLRKKLTDWNTCPQLMSDILDALFDSDPKLRLQEGLWPDNIWRGKIPLEWSVRQGSFLDRQANKRSVTEALWPPRLARAILDTAHSLWLIRNTHRHADPAAQYREQRESWDVQQKAATLPDPIREKLNLTAPKSRSAIRTTTIWGNVLVKQWKNLPPERDKNRTTLDSAVRATTLVADGEQAPARLISSSCSRPALTNALAPT